MRTSVASVLERTEKKASRSARATATSWGSGGWGRGVFGSVRDGGPDRTVQIGRRARSADGPKPEPIRGRGRGVRRWREAGYPGKVGRKWA
eukprot:1190192-Prorocentrum_minimum.AAC.1